MSIPSLADMKSLLPPYNPDSLMVLRSFILDIKVGDLMFLLIIKHD